MKALTSMALGNLKLENFMGWHIYNSVEVLYTVATINKENGTVLEDLMHQLGPAIFTVILENGSGMDKESCVTVKQEIYGQESGSKI